MNFFPIIGLGLNFTQAPILPHPSRGGGSNCPTSWSKLSDKVVLIVRQNLATRVIGTTLSGKQDHFRLFKSSGRKDGVQNPNTFSEANRMKFYAVLSHFAKGRHLRVKVLRDCPKQRGFSQFLQCLYLDCFSKHRPSGPMLSISRNVRLSVCPSVCVSVHF